MPSAALQAWQTTGASRLDELVKVHEGVAGVAPGRKFGTEQLNRSLFIALVAQFQGYCVALHDLAMVVHLQVAAPEQRFLMERLMMLGRALDAKNPRTNHLGSDFSRVGVPLIHDLKAQGPATRSRLRQLDLLVDFRNAIAHGNEAAIESMATSHGIRATKADFARYRRYITLLAPAIDRTVSAGLASNLSIPPPW